MSACSHALYLNLVKDLGKHLPSLNYDQLLNAKSKRALAWPGIGAKSFACLSLLDSLLKKFEDDKTSEADDAALAKFLAANDRCKSFSAIDTTNMTEIEAVCLGEFKKKMNDFFYLPYGDFILSPEVVLSGLGVGPGASVGVKGTNFYHKVAAGPLTGTRKSLFGLFKAETHKYPLWEEAENIRQNQFGGFVEVLGSKLSFVPKSRDVSRTTCTEPSLNMMIQKGIAAAFELQLERIFGINLSVQPEKNALLARIGSETEKFGTLDLTSASDLNSNGLIREIAPGYIVSWLMEARSPLTVLPSGEVVPLHMVSSMGNAFTFPLMTAIFACVVLGVYRALNIRPVFPKGKALGNFAVFGDDIVVCREAYDLVAKILRRIGHEPNLDKSFNEGPFRESCGADLWRGIDVRGVYCTSLKTKQDKYSLINRLNVWSANHCVALPNTVEYLWAIGKLSFIPVPPWESDVAGVKLPLRLADSFNLKRKRSTGSILYHRYLPCADSISMVDLGSRPNKRVDFHNPSGVLLTALAGYFKDGKLNFRQRRAYFEKRMAVAPCWDYRNPCHSRLSDDGWHRWLLYYVEVNLGKVLPLPA